MIILAHLYQDISEKLPFHIHHRPNYSIEYILINHYF